MMQPATADLRPKLKAFDFRALFVEGLGWNHFPATTPLAIRVDGQSFSLRPVAEKAGFAVYECCPTPGQPIPAYPIRRKIDNQVARMSFEHLVIFVDDQRRQQIWQWVKREGGKSRYREQHYNIAHSGEPLLQRLVELSFTFDEEQRLDIIGVASKVKKAFDVEKVTKKFYERFRKELTAFQGFIHGITSQGDRDWYASLMLNRMMFVYFVQKQGFLDGDLNYLRNRLVWLRQQNGGGKFHQFYRLFLLRLFHEGLGQPEAQRAQDLADLLGKVPFLNGGLFDVHDLERVNRNITIPDEAFEKLFEFFDSYRWHLDERPGRHDNEIDPDVLGYIFEKYINQKQMGAYYTREDITGYITRNAVIPYLLDAARKECPVAFGQDAGVWRLLREDPDRYIYPSVGHGVVWDVRRGRRPERLADPFRLPKNVERGISEISKRGNWHEPAPREYALPTETWREVVVRRQRYRRIRGTLVDGDVQDVNDLITLNLDIEQFANDVIEQSEGPELLRAVWQVMRDVSVLDPTCGSGAFLFAALNILEPLYRACLEGMRGFVADLDRTERTSHPNALSDFQAVLADVDEHANDRYFILKSIVLNNLYGVDIMDEAVEICKLRLFLKLIAQLDDYDQIEPLPDIDFNVRAGNTLVGFSSLAAVRQAMEVTPEGQYRTLSEQDHATLGRIESDARIASFAYDDFRKRQTVLHATPTGSEKARLRARLRKLDDELSRHLASEHGISANDDDAYMRWRTTHCPFHWFVEFYGIMNRGGFDVVIGNPPYIEYSKVRREYQVRGFVTEACRNLYAFVMERCKEVMRADGSISMIVPLSSHSTRRMMPLIDYFYRSFSSVHLSTFSGDANPSRLFDGVKFRLAIFIASHKKGGIVTTRYMRWYAKEREHLFTSLEYVPVGDLPLDTSIPKVSSSVHRSVLRKLDGHRSRIPEVGSSDGHIYYHSAPVNWIRAHTHTPYFHSARDGHKKSVELKPLAVAENRRTSIQAVLCSSTFFVWWLSRSDCYHLIKSQVAAFPMVHSARLAYLSSVLERDMASKTKRRVYHYKTTGRVEYDEFYMKLSKDIIDEIDRELARHYGFRAEELDFILNYDIKYRLGR